MVTPEGIAMMPNTSIAMLAAMVILATFTISTVQSARKANALLNASNRNTAQTQTRPVPRITTRPRQ